MFFSFYFGLDHGIKIVKIVLHGYHHWQLSHMPLITIDHITYGGIQFYSKQLFSKKKFILHVFFIPDVTNKDLSIIIIKAVS